MRTLKFIVDSTTIKQDPTCSFEGLFPGPNQQIEAEFSFSSEWENIPKVAAFYSLLGKEFPPQVLNEENRCRISPEALNLPAFRMQLLGINGNTMLSSNIITIFQRGGKI